MKWPRFSGRLNDLDVISGGGGVDATPTLHDQEGGMAADHAAALGLLALFPFQRLITDPLVAVHLLAGTYLLLVLAARQLLLFCSRILIRRSPPSGLSYMDRQQDVVGLEVIAGVLRARQGTALLAGGALLALLVPERGTEATYLVAAILLAAPAAVALIVGPSSSLPRTVAIPNPRALLILSLVAASLLFLAALAGSTVLSATLRISAAAASGGGLLLLLLASLPSLRLPEWLVLRNDLKDWTVRFDFCPADERYRRGSAHAVKKLAHATRELRNAVELTNGVSEIPVSGDVFVTGLLHQGGSGSELGRVRIVVEGITVLERAIASLSRGWNSFIDLHHQVREPMPAQVENAGSVPPGSQSLRVEVEGLSGRLFLECPHVMRRPLNQRNIVVVVADALAKDVLGFYGCSDVSTPNLDALASQGIVFDNAWAQGEWTTTNFAHMFTSLYSSHHKVVHRLDGHKHPLPERQETLAEAFQRNGWSTYLLSASQRVSQTKGYDRGFSRTVVLPYLTVRNWDVLYRFTDHLAAFRGENNFMFLHCMDTHGPPHFWSHKRDVHARFRQTNRQAIYRRTHPEEFEQLYRNQVEEFDLGMGLLLSYVDRPALRENTTIVLLADHGQFPTIGADSSDPVARHDPVLSKRILNVPLVVRCPWRSDLAGRRETALVEAGVDVYPTLLELADIEGFPSPYSRSFLPAPDRPFAGKPYALTESIYEGVIQRLVRTSDTVCYSRQRWRDGSPPDFQAWKLIAEELVHSGVGTENCQSQLTDLLRSLRFPESSEALEALYELT